MTWTLSAVPEQGGLASAAMRDPEFGDLYTHARQQFHVVSDGGQVYTQDLDVEDRFMEIGWRFISEAEWSDLVRVLRAGEWRSGLYKITIAGSSPFPIPLSTGMSIGGVPISTGQGLSTGDTVFADAAVLASLRLEQSAAQLEQILDQRGVVALRFRLPPVGNIVAGG